MDIIVGVTYEKFVKCTSPLNKVSWNIRVISCSR
jgi:hypothetical protein